jgi:hypothetical protein
MVPPVPTAEMNTSSWPCVSFQISSAVVLRWILGVRRVLELLRHDRARDFSEQFLGSRDRALHALRTGSEDKLRAEEGQHLAPLERHRLGHHEHEAVTPRRRNESERDARVAGGRLDQRSAGLDRALGFHRVDHVDADAVLDARDRIEELELEQDFGVDALLFREPVEADQRGVPDRFGDGAVDTTAAGLVLRLGRERRLEREFSHDDLLTRSSI